MRLYRSTHILQPISDIEVSITTLIVLYYNFKCTVSELNISYLVINIHSFINSLQSRYCLVKCMLRKYVN